ncbi:hypothetical protein ACQPU1_05475 [Clostridium paraputrificum]|uniref:hypothetical protein n=1 Tax=Clostridium TaxID=1485 RepID=UPI003D35436C
MAQAFRCIIKSEKSSYYIGKDYNGNKYTIAKNENIRCRVGDDFYFYARREKGLIRDKLIPVSDEEAGVVHKIKK